MKLNLNSRTPAETERDMNQKFAVLIEADNDNHLIVRNALHKAGFNILSGPHPIPEDTRATDVCFKFGYAKPTVEFTGTPAQHKHITK
jgi:hypothetical protein